MGRRVNNADTEERAPLIKNNNQGEGEREEEEEEEEEGNSGALDREENVAITVEEERTGEGNRDASSVALDWATLWLESKLLFAMAWPVIGSLLVSFINNIVPLLTLGRLGTKYLAAISLATMTANITGFSIGFGLNSALDTLCSQGFTGSDDKHALGKHLQRGIVILTFFSIPIFILWSFTEPILLALGQDVEIAYLSQQFMLYLMPGLIPNLYYNAVMKFLQAQGIMKAGLYIMLFSVPVNIFLQWFLTFYLNIGPNGAPMATSLTYLLNLVMLTIYASFFEGYQCWGGWDWKEAFDLRQLYTYLKLGLPGVAMLCSEWWSFEIVGLVAGSLGPEFLAAQSIIFNIGGITYMLPLGLGIACTTRVGNSLGSNLPYKARNIAHCGFVVGLILASINAITLYLCRDILGKIYTDDVDVIRLVGEVLPLAALFQLNDGLGAVGGGILRGLGRQNIGAYLNLIAYYVIALPLSGVFVWKLNLGLWGIWLGLTIGICLVSFVELYVIMFETNWVSMAEQALALVKSHASPNVEEGEESILQASS